MDDVDCVVAGAGVVGLAVARALARAGHDVIALEKHAAIGTETSSRNSEVIHAGLYYPPGSLKATACVRGRHLLYEFCQRTGVKHRRCGKLVVAVTADQVAILEQIESVAARNGVDDVEILSGSSALRMEPHLQCVAALHSPSTGIVDSHGFMLALLADAEQHNMSLALRSNVDSARVDPSGIDLATADGSRLRTRWLVNSCGLEATSLARRIHGFPAHCVPSLHLAKGNYYSMSGRSPFSRLVYPVPEHGGLGVHMTLDLDGRARFGPDVQWLDKIDYEVDSGRARGFYAAIRTYFPGLADDSLSPAYAGIRPKLSGPGEASADFLVQGPADHGVPGIVNLFGIESPGLTAALSIADQVATIVAGH